MSLAFEQQASAGLQQLGLSVAEQQLDQAAQQAAAATYSMPNCASATKKPCA